ncbi:MAG: LLM class flavin-dependent oxidoreductase [Sphingomonadaceae bacterium]|nr:LLM class flavin-dependent oxidoreductase [Sphingomonadaceae bacterium]
MSIRYNFRNPREWRRSSAALYNRILDQIAWADEAGFDRVTFAEHHFLEEGFLPSLMPICAAVAARTKRMLIDTEILLLPLHHPVRIAEDAAIVDIISNGRLTLSVAGGYREEEYAALGMKLSERAGRMEECLQILRNCWTKDCFSFDGRYYRLRDVRMFPKPVQPGGPRLVLGGGTMAVARRAARFADDMAPMDPAMWDVYYDELERLGRPAARVPHPTAPPALMHVTETPERDWEAIRPHAIFEVNQYSAWGLTNASSYGDLQPSEDTLRAIHKVWSVNEALEILLARQAEFQDSVFSFAPLLAGMDPELAQRSLGLIAARILPELKAARAT